MAFTRRASLVLTSLAVSSCTMVLGIDGEYRPKQDTVGPAAGGTTGGSSGSGGVGGVGGVGGAPDAAGGSGGQTCAPEQKFCSAVCVEKEPLWGCSAEPCEPCPQVGPADRSVHVCTDGVCDFKCIPDHERQGNDCQPISTGGSGGTDGGAGTTGVDSGAGCDAKTCGPCFPFGVVACCKADQTCGCTWAPPACW